jgi:ParB family chromosome partitioning protein
MTDSTVDPTTVVNVVRSSDYEGEKEIISDVLKTQEIRIDKTTPYQKHQFIKCEGDRLENLVESISKLGLQSPIVVRLIQDDMFEILSGHNRVEAYRLLNKEVISAIVKYNLSDADSEKIFLDSNLNQQSFSDWTHSQRIKVFKIYIKYLSENSQQGKRSDLNKMDDKPTSAHIEQKLQKKKGRPSLRDKMALSLGISPTVFERYRSIAKLDENTLQSLCDLLDSKRITFMQAFRLSKLNPDEIDFVQKWLNVNPNIKPNSKAYEILEKQSKENNTNNLSSLQENVIVEILTQIYQ